MWAVTVAVVVLSVFHALIGLISMCVGVASSIQAEVWLAHSVAPIWSGGFFAITGILGFACAKRKTAYMIMCFTAFTIVSLVVAVVSIQLLRLGLVNHTTDGHTFQKERKDPLILAALGDAGIECFICVISCIVSCRLAKAAKKELEKKREGTFHVQDDEIIWIGAEDTNYSCSAEAHAQGRDDDVDNISNSPDSIDANQSQPPVQNKYVIDDQSQLTPPVTDKQDHSWIFSISKHITKEHTGCLEKHQSFDAINTDCQMGSSSDLPDVDRPRVHTVLNVEA